MGPDEQHVEILSFFFQSCYLVRHFPVLRFPSLQSLKHTDPRVLRCTGRAKK